MKNSMKYVDVKYLNFDLIFFVITPWVCRIMAVLAFGASIYAACVALDAALVDNDFAVPVFGDADREWVLEEKKLWGRQLVAKNVLLERASGSSRESVKEGDFIQLTVKHGKDILNVIEKYKFRDADISTNPKADPNAPKQEFDFSKQILNFVQSIPEIQRKAYVSGWDGFLKDGLKSMETAKNVETPVWLTIKYDERFHAALVEAKTNKAVRIAKRDLHAGILLGSLMMFVQLVAVLAWLAIERRGRLRAEAAAESESPASESPAPLAAPASSEAPASTANCPTCGVPIEPDATFCGECGARLS